jgi:single stranded DNA-binding protein
VSQYNLNHVELRGNLGHNASIAYTPDRTAVVTFSVATRDCHQDGGGNWVTTRTDWHNIKVWGGGVCEDFAKGDTVLVKGKLRCDKREVEGRMQYYHFISAKPADVELISRKGARAQPQPAARDEYDIGDLGPPLDMDSPLSPGD